MVGLLMELDELGKLQEYDGALPALIQDALGVVSAGNCGAFADFYLYND